MNYLQLYIQMMFYVNKNLMYERFSFLKTKSEKANIYIYFILFIFKNFIFFWAAFIIVCNLFELYSIPFFVIIIALFSKLIQIDNNDWQLYFRNDYKLEIPVNYKRFWVVLSGNIINKLFIEDSVLIYFIVMKYFCNLSYTTIIALFFAYITLYIFIETFYFILRTGSIKIKKIYSFFSYILTMLLNFIAIFTIIRVFVLIFTNVDFSEFKEQPNEILKTLTDDIISFLNNIIDKILMYENYIFLILILLSIINLASIFFIKNIIQTENQKSQNIELKYPEFIKNHKFFKSKSEIQNILYKKEVKLYSYVYRYNFKQYFLSIFLDRTFSILAAIWLNLYLCNFTYSYVIFTAFSCIIFPLEISSSIGIKFITNLSFITDYSTLKLLNTNGKDIKELVKSKLLFYYNMRIIPSVMYVLISSLGIYLFKPPIYVLIGYILLIFVNFLLYPKIYFTNNLINTKMDYSNYDKYLEDSKILEMGTQDFISISSIFQIKVLITVFLTIFSFMLKKDIVLFLLISALFLYLILSLIDYLIMKKIQTNIELFVRGGNYSADIKKIF